MKHLFHQFMHGFLHLDHGIFYTAKQLALNPGNAIRDYLTGHRVRNFNPFTFILILGGISAFLLPKVHWESFFIDLGIMSKRAVDQEAWNSSLKHFSLRMLLSIPFYASISRLMYLKKGFNFSEHLIANTYLRGEVTLFMILVAPVGLFIKPGPVLSAIKLTMLAGVFFYVALAYAGLFDGRITLRSLTKSFVVVAVAAFLEMFILSLLISKELPF